jgi:anti-anti-sigma regulatory factor
VILDLRRVTEIDSTGAEVLRQIDADLSAQGASLALCVMQPSSRLRSWPIRVFWTR